MTRTYWLSFLDETRPPGQRHLGVCIVDVLEGDAEIARGLLSDLRARHDMPDPDNDAEWLLAATRLAHASGCNPGGQVAGYDITGRPEAATAPRDRLLQRAELVALGLAGSVQ